MPKSLVHFNHDKRPLKTRLGNPASSTNWASRVFFFFTTSLVIDWNNDLLSNRPEGSRGPKQNVDEIIVSIDEA